MPDLAITHPDDLLYGLAPHPVTCGHGLVIGDGEVVPEINFTLPPMEIDASSWPEVRSHYTQMIEGVLKRALELETPALLVEFETLPPMTIEPDWGLEITRLLADHLAEAHDRHGLLSALRLTPNDTREFERPPLMRQGRYWETMQDLFDRSPEAGADLLSIESTGGKELCDDALVHADLGMVVFSLGVLGCRDMRFLWDRIVASCRGTRMLPAGDSACGFANTAMVLADKMMIPRTFAAVVRVATVPRALQAFESGAMGPSKDCAYEGPYIKAMRGTPISMEGKSAACAHGSPVGNISAATCDCWSNESVQNVQLLSGKAPTVSMEQLIYDCRLMNVAAEGGVEDVRRLREWLVRSNAARDPQAYVLHPDVVWRISEQLAPITDPYQQTCKAAELALQEIRTAHAAGELALPEREVPWLDLLDLAIQELPATEEQMIERMIPLVSPDTCNLGEYGIEVQ